MKIFAAVEPPKSINPCLLGTCGPNSECHVLDGRAVCSCSFGMLGAPPNCRPECVIHQECPSSRACIAQQCQDPCIGSCGFNARCTTQNHQPICSCIEGYEGDPYASCTPRQSEYNFFGLHDYIIMYFYYRYEQLFEHFFDHSFHWYSLHLCYIFFIHRNKFEEKSMRKKSTLIHYIIVTI